MIYLQLRRQSLAHVAEVAATILPVPAVVEETSHSQHHHCQVPNDWPRTLFRIIEPALANLSFHHHRYQPLTIISLPLYQLYFQLHHPPALFVHGLWLVTHFHFPRHHCSPLIIPIPYFLLNLQITSGPLPDSMLRTRKHHML